MTLTENVMHITLFSYIIHTHKVLQPTLKIQQFNRNQGCNKPSNLWKFHLQELRISLSTISNGPTYRGLNFPFLPNLIAPSLVTLSKILDHRPQILKVVDDSAYISSVDPHKLWTFSLRLNLLWDCIHFFLSQKPSFLSLMPVDRQPTLSPI